MLFLSNLMTLPSRWLQKLPLALVPKVVEVIGMDTYITFTMSVARRWHWREEMAFVCIRVREISGRVISRLITC
jgi:hypothetical protein